MIGVITAEAESVNLNPPIYAEMKKFIIHDPPIPIPDIPLLGLRGQSIKLSSNTKQLLMINFWATWCTPCIRELPSIIRLKNKINNQRFDVLLVSVDLGGANVYGPFLKKRGFDILNSAGDSQRTLMSAVTKSTGIPVTILINADSKVIGSFIGPAEWDSAAALELISYFLSQY